MKRMLALLLTELLEFQLLTGLAFMMALINPVVLSLTFCALQPNPRIFIFLSH